MLHESPHFLRECSRVTLSDFSVSPHAALSDHSLSAELRGHYVSHYVMHSPLFFCLSVSMISQKVVGGF